MVCGGCPSTPLLLIASHLSYTDIKKHYFVVVELLPWSLIQVLVSLLYRSQLKCDELEEQNRDLFSQYSALEKDKKDITDYLKRSVAVKEKKVDELEEQLESQRRAAERDREALNLQQNQQMQKLQEQISKLNSQSMTQGETVTKCTGLVFCYYYKDNGRSQKL